MVVHASLGEGEPTSRDGGDHGHAEHVDHLAAIAHLPFADRSADGHPQHERTGDQERVQAVVQRAAVGAAIHQGGNVGDHDDDVVDERGSDGPRQEPHGPVGASLTDEQPEEPLGSGQQRQGWDEEGQDHVLEHVNRIEVFLGDVVHRPVAREPQQQDHDHEVPDLLAGHHLSGRRGLRSDDPHRVDERCDQSEDQDPDLEMELEAPRVGVDRRVDCREEHRLLRWAIRRGRT